MVEHTAKEVVGKLKEQGFVNDHVTGDHHIFVNSNGKNVRLQSGHNVTPRKLVCLYHVNGILTTKIPLVLE